MEQILADLVGFGVSEPNIVQAMVRAAIVFLCALLMVRIGEKRFMGKNTAFDVILGVMLGSVLSRGINSADLLPSLAAGSVLVVLHWTFAKIAFHASWFGTLVKGETRVLVQDGKVDWEQMQASHTSEDDLLAALRSQGVAGWENVREARLERSGEVSVLTK